MESIPQVTLVFTALLILVSVPMSITVGLRRAKTGIQLLHGDDDELLRRIRAHGNFTEYVPLALIALAGAEVAGVPTWLVVTCGTVLLLGRLIHYVSLRRAPDGTGRLIGAAATSIVSLTLGTSILLQLAGWI